MKQETNKTISRRGFFKTSLGVAGTVAASSSVAQVCGIQTGEQGLGPFFPQPGTPVDPVRESPDGSLPIYLANDNDLTFVKGRTGQASGQQVLVQGVLSSDCQPVAGATIIIWQASESGRYNHKGDAQNHDFKDPRTGETIQRTLDPSFQSWGQAVTNAQGEYEFKTIVPGYYPADLNSGWYRPPHIHFMVMATGFPQFVTQMYFEGEEIKDNEWIQELNQKDLLLQGNNLSEQQKQDLVVHFQRQPSRDALVGTFDLKISR